MRSLMILIRSSLVLKNDNLPRRNILKLFVCLFCFWHAFHKPSQNKTVVKETTGCLHVCMFMLLFTFATAIVLLFFLNQFKTYYLRFNTIWRLFSKLQKNKNKMLPSILSINRYFLTASIVSQHAQLTFYTLDGVRNLPARAKFIWKIVYFSLVDISEIVSILKSVRVKSIYVGAAMRIDLKLNTRYMTKCCSSSQREEVKERQREEETV